MSVEIRVIEDKTPIDVGYEISALLKVECILIAFRNIRNRINRKLVLDANLTETWSLI